MTDLRAPRRPAWTLLELLLVMSISAVIAGIAVTLLVSLRHQQRATAGRHWHQESLYRLAEQFRTDVHAAASVANEPLEIEGQDPDVQLVCRLPGGAVVRYAVVHGRLRRTGPGTAEQDARETYALCEGTVVSWSLDDQATLSTVELIVDYPIAGTESRRRRLPIVARVGRDLRASADKTARDSEGR